MKMRTKRRTPGVEYLDGRILLSAYVVAPGGSDSAAGTVAAPWQTLQRAANAVQAGDTVSVRAGTYAGFDLRTSGTSAAPIVFQADPGVTINRQESVRNRDGINLEGASYVTIQGFTVTGVPEAGIRSVENSHVTIRNNVTDRNAVWGIFTGFSDDLLIEGNTASNSAQQHGIYVSNSGDRPVVRNNVVFGNRASGIQLNADISSGGDGIITGALIEGNTIYDNGRTGGSAINLDGVQGSTIRNNLMYNNHASGISLFQQDGGGPSSGDLVVNNTILVASDGRWALNLQNGAVNTTARNNILLNDSSFTGSVDVSADSLPGLVSDYNVVMNRFTTDDGGSRLSLAQWRAQTGQDAHSLVSTAAALFVNPAGNNYHLASAGPAVDAGTPTGAPATDLDGKPRPSGNGYDIGTYEYQAAPTVPEAPQVRSTQVDIGTAQRSAVRSLTVTFSTPVTLGAGAFTLAGLPGGARLVVAPSAGDARAFTITFAGAGIVGGSLPDGHYTLVVNAAQVKGASTGQAMAANQSTTFDRFYGDSNGDGVVDAVDYVAFRQAYLTGGAAGANAVYDSNGDGLLTPADLNAFTLNMRRRRL